MSLLEIYDTLICSVPCNVLHTKIITLSISFTYIRSFDRNHWSRYGLYFEIPILVKQVNKSLTCPYTRNKSLNICMTQIPYGITAFNCTNWPYRKEDDVTRWWFRYRHIPMHLMFFGVKDIGSIVLIVSMLTLNESYTL